jgi:hypothetical protein
MSICAFAGGLCFEQWSLLIFSGAVNSGYQANNMNSMT